MNSIPKKLEKYLHKHRVQYEIIVHPTRYTSDEIAQAEHVPGNQVAKVVMLRCHDKDVMAVFPASHSVDFFNMSTMLGTQDVRMERESEFAKLFPDCEVGAMPPFGKLYGLPLYCDRSLAKELEIEFNAGTHTDTIRMEFSEFERLEAPIILNFSEKFTGKPMARTA